MSDNLRNVRERKLILQEEINEINSLVEKYLRHSTKLKKEILTLEIAEQEELKRKLEESKKKVLR